MKEDDFKMEFNEKLQLLRKKHDLTQEQLAEKLYVSRTAISKWEQGKGYPNIQSLKDISFFFSISIDELLSGEELISLAETENRHRMNLLYGLIFGILDLFVIAFCFMPLYGQQSESTVHSVALFVSSDLSNTTKFIHFISLSIISLFGAFELIIEKIKKEKYLNICIWISMITHTIAVMIFAISHQPYLTVLLFLLLICKTVLFVRKIYRK